MQVMTQSQMYNIQI